MAKIATTRLPDSTPEYEPSQFDATYSCVGADNTTIKLWISTRYKR